MPKMKTRSAVKKRFKLTANGHVKKAKSFKRHILTSKSSKRKRNLRRTGIVSPAMEDKIKLMMC